MQVATVKLRNKTTGAVIKVNATDYATDLGQHKYKDYMLASTYRGDETSEQEKAAQAEVQANAEKLRKDAGSDAAAQELDVPAVDVEKPSRTSRTRRGSSN